VIHVLRPYASEEEYLASERLSIAAKTMLLIDQPPLPTETTIVFDVSLTNGQKPIRAEGVVLGHVTASAEQPGGLRVRFKRYGAATKAFIDRAVSGAPAPSLPLVPAAPAAALSQLAAETQQAQAEPPPSAPEPIGRGSAESSGVHRKAVLPVAAPANREALLGRLRARRAG
jgi:hypothetical protein